MAEEWGRQHGNSVDQRHREEPRAGVPGELREGLRALEEQAQRRHAAQRQYAPPAPSGRTFTKSARLPDGQSEHAVVRGPLPIDILWDYGHCAILGGCEQTRSGVPLRLIHPCRGTDLLGRLGALTLSAPHCRACVSRDAAADNLLGLLALLWPARLDDSALYSETELRRLKRATTRVRLHLEQLADGRLKGYAFYTGGRRDWEQVDVIPFVPRGECLVADFGDGAELLWSPAATADQAGIPLLRNPPKVPQIWVFPPSDAADSIILDPIFPPDYRDAILLFPAGSGIPPLYAVIGTTRPGG